MDNNIVLSSNISAPQAEGDIDGAIDLGNAWRFNTAKSWIKIIENDASVLNF